MIIVCVTEQEHCERLIRTGHQLAQDNKSALTVLSIMPRSRGTADGLASPEMEYLYRITRSLHATMQILFDDDAAGSAIEFIQTQTEAVEGIVIGQPDYSRESGFVPLLLDAFPELSFYTISKSGIMLPVAAQDLSLA